MKKLISSLILLFAINGFAYEANVLFYIFENQGRVNYGYVPVADKMVAIPIDATWFDWNCAAHRQIDGLLITCQKGNESFESKLFCTSNKDMTVRALRLTKDQNFVSIEGYCKMDQAELQKYMASQARRMKKVEEAQKAHTEPPPPQEMSAPSAMPLPADALATPTPVPTENLPPPAANDPTLAPAVDQSGSQNSSTENKPSAQVKKKKKKAKKIAKKPVEKPADKPADPAAAPAPNTVPTDSAALPMPPPTDVQNPNFEQKPEVINTDPNSMKTSADQKPSNMNTPEVRPEDIEPLDNTNKTKKKAKRGGDPLDELISNSPKSSPKKSKKDKLVDEADDLESELDAQIQNSDKKDLSLDDELSLDGPPEPVKKSNNKKSNKPKGLDEDFDDISSAPQSAEPTLELDEAPAKKTNKKSSGKSKENEELMLGEELDMDAPAPKKKSTQQKSDELKLDDELQMEEPAPKKKAAKTEKKSNKSADLDELSLDDEIKSESKSKKSNSTKKAELKLDDELQMDEEPKKSSSSKKSSSGTSSGSSKSKKAPEPKADPDFE